MAKDTKHTSLPNMVLATVQRFGDKTACIDPVGENGYVEVSYQQLWTHVMSVASALVHHGVMPADRIGLLAESRSWWPICDVAIMSTGAWTVPIYPNLPANQVQHIVNHAGMRGIFVQDCHQFAKLQEVAAELPTLEFVVLLDATNVSIDSDYPWQVCTYTEWIHVTYDASTVAERMSGIVRNDVATIVYTSGTTGLPKGVLLTHDNLLGNLEGIHTAFEVLPQDRILSYLPLSHIFERTVGQFLPLNVGATIAYSRGINYIAEDFLRMPPTIFTTVPRLLEKVYEKIMHNMESQSPLKKKLLKRAVSMGAMVRVDRKKPIGWQLRFYDRLVFSKIKAALGGQIRVIVIGGAPMPTYVGRFLMAAGVPMIEGYGMTESSPVIAVNPLGDPRLGTVGKVLDNVQISIADDGEVLAKGPSITQGYYKDEKSTVDVFTQEGWLRTGDIGEMTSEGYLRITDRKKNLLVLSTGKKVTPAPIESDLLKSPYIDQVLLVGQARKFVSVIVVPARDAIAAWLKQKNRHVAPSSYTTDKGVYELLLTEVQRETGSYAVFEQPKKLLVIAEPFTIENGQLTPTLKVKAKVVLAKYDLAINNLYGESSVELGQTGVGG